MDADIHNVKQVVIDKSTELLGGSYSTRIVVCSTQYIQGADRPVEFQVTLFSDTPLTIDEVRNVHDDA